MKFLDLTLTIADGDSVPLKSFMTTKPGLGPILIDRRNQQRQVRVLANVAGRDMGSVAIETQKLLNQIPRPSGYDLRISGAWEEQQKSFNELLVSLDQALVMALEANPGIRVERYNPVLAGFSEKIERSRFDPELFSELSYAKC